MSNPWVLTFHAREQMAERGIALDQIDALLAKPKVTIPSALRPDCRILVDDVMLAVVNETTREVITVGYKGASNRDWETFAAPQSGTMPAEPVRHRKRRKKVKEPGLPVDRSSVLDGVHESVADGVRAYLAANDLDFRSVRVLGPTQVEIIPPKER